MLILQIGILRLRGDKGLAQITQQETVSETWQSAVSYPGLPPIFPALIPVLFPSSLWREQMVSVISSLPLRIMDPGVQSTLSVSRAQLTQALCTSKDAVSLPPRRVALLKLGLACGSRPGLNSNSRTRRREPALSIPCARHTDTAGLLLLLCI